MIQRDELELMEAVLTERKLDFPNSHVIPHRYWLDDGPIPQKRLYFVLLKWVEKNIWDYGVSPRAGWVSNLENFRQRYEQAKKNVRRQ